MVNVKAICHSTRNVQRLAIIYFVPILKVHDDISKLLNLNVFFLVTQYLAFFFCHFRFVVSNNMIFINLLAFVCSSDRAVNVDYRAKDYSMSFLKGQINFMPIFIKIHTLTSQ